MRKRFLSAVLCLLMLLTLVSCGQNDAVETEPESNPAMELQTVTKHGVECYQVGRVQYPAVFGEPKLTDEELDKLLTELDAAEVADSITTVPDCLRYLDRLNLSEGWIAGEGPHTVIETHQCKPYSICETMLYLLSDDLEEAGRIDLSAEDNGYCLCCMKVEGTYYAFDPFPMCWNEEALWLDNLDDAGTYDSTNIEELINSLVKYCGYSPFTSGEYIVSPYKAGGDLLRAASVSKEEAKAVMEKLTTPQLTAAQIEEGLEQGLSLDEWAELVKTPADALLFLDSIGYPESYEVNINANVWDERGIDWGFIFNAEEVYKVSSGGCGGTSTLMNKLLAEDFEEAGYVEYTSNIAGHIFNYFKVDGLYVMCDFVDLFIYERPVNTTDYIVHISRTPEEFGSYYVASKPWYTDPTDSGYIHYLWMYERNGSKLPKGSTRSKEAEIIFDGNIEYVWNVLPQQYQEQITVLYQSHDIELIWAPFIEELRPVTCR